MLNAISVFNTTLITTTIFLQIFNKTRFFELLNKNLPYKISIHNCYSI